MILFRNYFADVDFDAVNDSDEVAVRCPFQHSSNGVSYFESVPSAHINVEKNVFHCKVCGEKHSEPSFLSKIHGLSYPAAIKLIKHLEHNALPDRWTTAEMALWESTLAINLLNKIHITRETAKALHLGFEGEGVSFPVFAFGELMDVRKYRPGKTPKVKSRLGVNAGYLIPDVSKMIDKKEVLICAGEKDMAIARSLGFEAYTITGGESRLPSDYGFAFRNKKVYVIYDNDDAGIEGSKKLGRFIHDNGGTPYLVYGHHKVATEKGGDLWDYLVTYKKTKEDLLELLYLTEEMSEDEIRKEKEKEVPNINLAYAMEPQHRNRYISSLVQVTATYNNTFGIPDVIEAEKVSVGERASYNVMPLGYKMIYTIDHTNNEDILYLMDSGLKEQQVQKNIKDLLRIPQREEFIHIRSLSHATVYKSTVVNHNISTEDAPPTEIDVYSFEPLENGHKYRITYKIVQHPLRQQELVGIVESVVSVDNDLEDFKVTETVKRNLSQFMQQDGQSVNEAMDRLFELDKGYIGAEANKNIAQTVDLVYNTPLTIKVGKNTIRGALDVFMVGATRTGKSKTSKVKREIYNLGSVINLGTTTVPGLIGGTNKATNRTRIGLLPREHKNLVVLEEFSSMKDTAFIKAMTDIRSSNEIRIVRVDSDLRVPCQLRMITISNPKNHANGGTKSMKSYPNGIEIISELIGSPEDIARYDFFTLVPEPEEYASFLDIDYERLPKQNYRDRVRWVWTRKPEDILIPAPVQKHLWDVSVDLNRRFNTHIKIFGTEAWMKVLRIAVASAGMLVSTDQSFEKIIVTKEHIDWARDFLVRLYDNDTFKLRQFVHEQRKYTEVDDILVTELQDLYTKNATLMNFLEMNSGVTRATLRDISGMANEEFSVLLNEMARLYLFTWVSGVLVPSERFRKALGMINRQVKVDKGGIV